MALGSLAEKWRTTREVVTRRLTLPFPHAVALERLYHKDPLVKLFVLALVGERDVSAVRYACLMRRVRARRRRRPGADTDGGAHPTPAPRR